MPGQYKTQKICEKVVENMPQALEYVTDQYKTQKYGMKLLKECHSY